MRNMVVLSLLMTFPMVQTVFASSQATNEYSDEVSGWKLIYENDESGKTINGTLSALIMAVKKGMDIKILNQIGNRVELISCPEVVLFDDPGFPNVVACFSSHVETDLDVDKATNTIKLKTDFSKRQATYNSNGEIELSSDITSRKSYPLPQKGCFKWFVKEH